MDGLNLIPMVIESSGRGERAYDIYSLLLKNRIIFLGTPINDQVANTIIAQMLFLDQDDPNREILFYINSPGGQITSGLAIYDTMQLISAPVTTVAVGMAASMATILLTAGTAGRRSALPNATIHLHQPLGGVQGQAVDIEIEAREILRMRDVLNDLLRKHAGFTAEEVQRYTDRNFSMTAEKAKELGLIDRVLAKPQDAARKPAE